MKCPLSIETLLLCSLVTVVVAAEPPGGKLQTGRMATAQLLATARVASSEVPDGMRFLFFIRRQPDITGNFTLKETRDFLVGGESYQEKTLAELGKRIEPQTVFDTAENFFSRQPGARHLAPEDIKAAYILTITIGGARLSPGTRADITINVGFEKQVEPFTFRAPVPPGGPPRPKA